VFDTPQPICNNRGLRFEKGAYPPHTGSACEPFASTDDGPKTDLIAAFAHSGASWEYLKNDPD
jgi:hypothetical protein